MLSQHNYKERAYKITPYTILTYTHNERRNKTMTIPTQEKIDSLTAQDLIDCKEDTVYDLYISVREEIKRGFRG